MKKNIIKIAVERTLNRIDDLISGESIVLPDPKYRRAVEIFLDKQSASARTAALFLMFYWLEEPSWDLRSVPIGIRGASGDKLLSEGLTTRNITFHNSITAFGENLGWKGSVRATNLETHLSFKDFVKALNGASVNQRKKIADLIAQRFAESKLETTPLPPVADDVLTFSRAKQLFMSLQELPTEGHVQQFLIAALLTEFRKSQKISVITHHPHAADRFDNTAGDIEETFDGNLVRAYEITVRNDWKNRISNFKSKMDRFGLKKYTIIARGVNQDEIWSEPAKTSLALEPYGRDIAVVDITDLLNFFAADLSAKELRSSVNIAYSMLSDLRLCGRHGFKELYVETVRQWLDLTTKTN
jgi:hypothetical protein